MKIKLLTARATATDPQNRGDVIEVGAEEGQRMIDADQAVLLRSEKTTEKAVKQPKFERAAK